MATIANLSLKKADDTAHVYVPASVVSGKEAHWTNRDNESVALQPMADVFLNQSGTTRKVNLKLTIPSVSTADATVINKSIAKVEVVVPLNTTLDQRKALSNSIQAFVADAFFDSAVQNGEMPWA